MKKETGNCWTHSPTTSRVEAAAVKVLPRRQSNVTGLVAGEACCKPVLQPVVRPFEVSAFEPVPFIQ